jgi:hypothetical protein
VQGLPDSGQMVVKAGNVDNEALDDDINGD